MTCMEQPQVAVFIDVENLLHEQPADELRGIVAGLGERGHVIQAVAVGHGGIIASLVPVMRELGIRGFVHRGGPDAADRALIDRIRRDLPARIDTVVICSGDHAFAPVARELRAAGVHVVVVARTLELSHLLYSAADEVQLLPPCRCTVAV